MAPGRVNLIGEHTDYNDGFVFPVAINYHTAVAAARRADRVLDVVARDEAGQRVQIDLDAPMTPDGAAPWSNYVRGVVQQLRAEGFELCGANLAISGNVPLGAGLSSSAALEMALIAALTQLSEDPINAIQAARIGQAAENRFVGVQCGIMDQLISAAGEVGHALLLDCRSLTFKTVPLPAELSILVLNSNVRRGLVDGEYNQRRTQCEEALSFFQVPALRDLTVETLLSAERELDAVVYRRARHVVTENQRTLDMLQALTANDIATVSALMQQSHDSMRYDFEITVPAIDSLVDIVASVVGAEGGARMTGGGFGGCVVALLPHSLIEPVLRAVDERYAPLTGHPATPFVCQASNGAFAGLTS